MKRGLPESDDDLPLQHAQPAKKNNSEIAPEPASEDFNDISARWADQDPHLDNYLLDLWGEIEAEAPTDTPPRTRRRRQSTKGSGTKAS